MQQEPYGLPRLAQRAAVWLCGLLLIALCFLPLPSLPAAAQVSPGTLRWHTFTSDNGLAGNIVQAIWEDPQGYVWFGTENGVSRYDGYRWKTYRTREGLLDNNVWSISGDTDSVWFATSSGVSVFQQQEDRWQSYTTRDGLPDNDVRSVLVSRDGTVWVGTFGNGIGRKLSQSQRWEQVDISSRIRTRDVVVHSIWQAPAGQIWFATTAFGALRFDGQQWELFSFRQPARNTVWAVGSGVDASDTTLATFRGVVSIDRDDHIEVLDRVVEGVDITDTEVIATAGRRFYNELWFGTRAHGAFHFSRDEWQRYTVEDGLSRNYVQTILVDHNGRVWFGTRGGGVTLLNRQPLPQDTLHAVVTGQDVQSNRPLPESSAQLDYSQNNLQFTFTLPAPWLPPHDVSFRYWLEEEGATIATGQQTVRSDPAPAVIARSEVFVGLSPGSYTLHVVPFIGNIQGVETTYPFTIGSAPPSLTADTIRVIADAQSVERGLTLPQSLFDSTRRVRLEFAASDDVTAPAHLHYYYQVNMLTSPWQEAEHAQAVVALPQGQHTISIQAADADGNRSQPVTITVIVPAPLWKTILVALLLILIPSIISGTIGAFGYQRWSRRQALRRAVSGYFIPYDVGPLITVPDRYIGRQHILDTILGKIDNNSFHITGEKRIGKTSLLLLLKQRLIQRNSVQTAATYIPVFRNMQDLPQEQFWLYLMRSIAAEIPAVSSALAACTAAVGTYDDFDAENDLETIVQHLQRGAGQRQFYIVLLLDEVDTLQRYDASIRQRFRAFCQHTQRNVRVVLAGVLAPRVEPTETSPWYNIFEPMTLGPLAQDDTLFLIRNYNHNPYVYTAEAEQAILSASGGKPFATQWLCSEAVKSMLAARRTKVTLFDVEQAVQIVESERSV